MFEGTPLSLPRWNQLSMLMSVGEQVMARWKLKLPCKKSIVQKSYECKRNQMLGAQSKGCWSGLHMRGAPVWTQYIAIFTVHDDPRQCEHVLS